MRPYIIEFVFKPLLLLLIVEFQPKRRQLHCVELERGISELSHHVTASAENEDNWAEREIGPAQTGNQGHSSLIGFKSLSPLAERGLSDLNVTA